MAQLNLHDRLFRGTFSDPREAAAFLQRIVPGMLEHQIDWSTLSLVPTETVGEKLRGRSSDLVFSAKLRDARPAFIYVLLEHQSTEDRWMMWRFLEYLVRFWQQLSPIV